MSVVFLFSLMQREILDLILEVEVFQNWITGCSKHTIPHTSKMILC